MLAPYVVGIVAVPELRPSKLADRFEQSQPSWGSRGPNPGHQVLFDEGGNNLEYIDVSIVAADAFYSFERPPRCEHGDLLEDALLLLGEKIVAPFDCFPKAPLPRRA